MKDLLVEGEWATTGGDDPKSFLLYDGGSDAISRMLIFATHNCLKLLSGSKVWFMDGNYKTAPKQFLQLYVIWVPLGSTAVSVVYMLLQRKNQATYEEMLQALIEKCHENNLCPDPTTIMVDFQLPMLNSIKNVIRVDACGCFYHKAQATVYMA